MLDFKPCVEILTPVEQFGQTLQKWVGVYTPPLGLSTLEPVLGGCQSGTHFGPFPG